MTTDAQSNEADFFDDMIEGADKIALFLFKRLITDAIGAEREKLVRKYRRKVYHLVETSRLPVFRLGTVICARKSSLRVWIEEQEKRTSRNTRGVEHPATAATS